MSGRPRKKTQPKAIEKDDELLDENEVTVEQSTEPEVIEKPVQDVVIEPVKEIESPQSAERKIAVKQDVKAKAMAVGIKTSYLVKGNKVVKIVEKKNGNKFSSYLLDKAKHPRDYEALVKKVGKDNIKLG